MKLSFVVPVYNVAPYLRMCVASLLDQDMSKDEYEIILVDDGSTDNSGVICDEYSTQYTLHHTPSIRVIHQKNAGLSAARNTGIAAANGEYICFVDSDDYWRHNVLADLMAQIERDQLDVLRFRLQYVNPEGKAYNPYKSDPFKGNDYSEVPTDGVSFLNSRMNTRCYAWQFILRRDLIYTLHNTSIITHNTSGENVMFTPGIYFEDTDWTPRMLCRAKQVASTNTIVYNYLMREGSITNAVNRSKQKKVLDDKMLLVTSLQNQSNKLASEGKDNQWFKRMIADTIISIITILGTQFYQERKEYLAKLQEMRIYPIQSRIAKAKLINLSPRLAVELLHLKNH